MMNPTQTAATGGAHDLDPQRPTALITGGAKRVGLAIVELLAERGYRVVVHANRSRDEAEAVVGRLAEAGHEALAVTGDVRDSTAVRQMLDATLARFGRIDALVNCAAIWRRKPLEEVTADDVREHFEVNALGTFLCCREMGLAMAAQSDGGAIVNIGDWAVARPYVDFAAYFPSKGAIPTLTRCLAIELAQRNPRVRVNAILPGPVLLPPDMPADERAEAIHATLVKREGHPRHIAHATLFLIENDFVTGVSLPVDGGRTIFNGSFDRDG